MEIEKYYSIDEMCAELEISRKDILRVIHRFDILYNKRRNKKQFFNVQNFYTIKAKIDKDREITRYYPIKLYEQFYIYESKMNK